MNIQNLYFLQEAFLCTQNLSTWCLSEEMKLIYSNCPEQDFFYTLFSISTCPDTIKNHFQNNSTPLIISDDIGFVWICTMLVNKSHEKGLYYLLGPIFTSELTATYIKSRCSKMPIKFDMLNNVTHYIRQTPVITSSSASSYATILHFCINENVVSNRDIKIIYSRLDNDENLWGDTNWHDSWLSEQRLFKSIKEGRLEDQGSVYHGKIGNIGGGEPLRQAKNEMIVFAVLCSRAAIFGGVSSEGALNLSDQFIQLIEASNSVSNIYDIGGQMHQAFVQRVRDAKANSKYSPSVQAIIEYIKTHIHEKIKLKDIASNIGYSEYHISRIFHKETNINIVDFINTEKIELAKLYLSDSPSAKVSDVSEYLGFSSPSYFIAIFKKIEGISPSEYMKSKKISD